MNIHKWKYRTGLVVLSGVASLLTVAAPAPAHAAFMVAPFLQNATPQSMWVVWETDVSHIGQTGEIAYGTTTDLAEGTVVGSQVPLVGGGILFEGQLVDLAPATRYYYQVTVGDAQSDMAEFVTPGTADAEEPTRLVAMSDMQRGEEADKFREIVHDGVLDWVDDNYDAPLSEALDMVVIPGDLVSQGAVYDHWVSHFFGPIAPLIAQVPLYAVPGNHEDDHHFFFDYFNFPSNGSPAFEGHWWTVDHSNVRLIGLDTNGLYGLGQQPIWLDEVLEETCDDPTIDFVFAQFHHPAQSEMWVIGESGFSGMIVEKLEDFSSRCGKPSVHFYGHTHSYARGQSRDHEHLWVNVASGGGSIDYWGEYPHTDYAETSRSTADYGFVIMDVEAGDSPSFQLTRVTRGDINTVLDNVVTDTIRIRRDNTPPEAPQPVQPAGAGIAAECATLRIEDDYFDADGDAFQAVHWQVASDCDTFDDIVAEDWQQSENVFYEEDLQAGASFDASRFIDLPGESDLCWRVRVRDDGLRWSDWSVSVPFTTNASRQTDNLVVNPHAANRTDGWLVVAGNAAAVPGRDCGGQYPRTGNRLFAVGSPCEPSPRAVMVQEVPLAEWQDAIDAGTAMARFGAAIATVQGLAEPSVELAFYDAGGVEVGTATTLESQAPRWVAVEAIVDIPALARTAELRLVGQRQADAALDAPNHSYFDDVRFHMLAEGTGDAPCDAAGDGEIPPPVVTDDVGVSQDVGNDTSDDVGVDAGEDVDDDAAQDVNEDAAVDAGATDTGSEADTSGTEGRVEGGASCAASPLTFGWWFLALSLPMFRRRD